jgi:peptidoglycan/LPS O-acetylase OafA/YrhL
MEAPSLSRTLSATRQQNCFDALRLFAALSVAVNHFTTHLNSNFLWFTPGKAWWFCDGVMMFFILSGGMVYRSAERCMTQGRPVREYLKNRFLRIVPAVYAYLAVMILILLTLRVITPGAAADPGFLAWIGSGMVLAPVYHPAILQDFGVGVVNGSLWTIPVEVSFYLLVPAMAWLAGRWGFWKTMAAALTLGATGMLGYAVLGGYDTELPAAKLLGVTFVPWLAFFVVGIVIARIWRRLPQHWFLAVGAAALYLATYAWRTQVGPDTSLIISLVSVVPLSYVTFWLGYRGPGVVQRVTARLGDLSFGVYIWHMPVVNILIWLGLEQGPLHGTGLVLAALGVTVGIAFVSWHLVERPALKLKRYTSRSEGCGHPSRCEPEVRGPDEAWSRPGSARTAPPG